MVKGTDDTFVHTKFSKSIWNTLSCGIECPLRGYLIMANPDLLNNTKLLLSPVTYTMEHSTYAAMHGRLQLI